eukprot:421975-Pleurochrysis_carterae.AAC.3
MVVMRALLSSRFHGNSACGLTTVSVNSYQFQKEHQNERADGEAAIPRRRLDMLADLSCSVGDDLRGRDVVIVQHGERSLVAPSSRQAPSKQERACILLVPSACAYPPQITSRSRAKLVDAAAGLALERVETERRRHARGGRASGSSAPCRRSWRPRKRSSRSWSGTGRSSRRVRTCAARRRPLVKTVARRGAHHSKRALRTAAIDAKTRAAKVPP